MKQNPSSKTNSPWLLHLFFLAVYPILFLLANNIDNLAISQAIRPSILSIAVTLALLALFGYSTHNFTQAAILVSLILILFYSYGHVFRLLQVYAPVFSNHLFLGLLWLLILLIGTKYKWKIQNTVSFTSTMNLISGCLLIFPIVTIGIYLVQSGRMINIENNAQPAIDIPSPPQSSPQTNPDIYYIILDGYGRSDILEEIYGYNNSEFIEALKRRGFLIATESSSNYVQTALSLSSSLNFGYINYLQDNTTEGYRNRDPLAALIQHSKVREFLESQMYQTVSFSTGYGITTIEDADIFYSYDPNIISDLESMLLVTSATRMLGDRMQNLFRPFNCQMQREGILNIFEGLKNISSQPGQQFIFAHILAPHPPFVFGENGEESQFGECNGLDGSKFEGTKQDYKVGYAKQASFISKKTIETIDHILANSEVTPIIILQGDHGPGLLLNENQAESSCLRERTAILNAYFLPGNPTFSVSESTTPVNTFRIILNLYFKAELPMLDNKIYFSAWDSPYVFTDVTQSIESSCSEFLND